MMARSGQVYGLLGSVALATAQHQEKLISDDVIRIKAGPAIAPGYLYVALSHPTLGRPRAKALAYGSSVPHIAVDDLQALAIPRLNRTVERRIAALVEDGVALWAEADAREQRLAAFAEEMLQAFLTRSSGGGSGPRTAGAGRMEKTPHRQTKRVAGEAETARALRAAEGAEGHKPVTETRTVPGPSATYPMPSSERPSSNSFIANASGSSRRRESAGLGCRPFAGPG